VGKGIRANHDAERREIGADHAQPVARRVERMANLQLVQLAVPQQQLATGADQHRRIVDIRPVPLHEASADVEAVRPRRLGQRAKRRALGNGLRQRVGRRVRPAEIAALL